MRKEGHSIPHCRKGDILKKVHKRFIMYQLFRATNYLHSGNVIHRDQKPSNVLLDCECNCKIAGKSKFHITERLTFIMHSLFPFTSPSHNNECRFRAGPIAHLASKGGKRSRERVVGGQPGQRLPHGLRGDPVVPGAGDPPGEEELHEGGRHVEPGLHPGRDDRRQAALPGQEHHGPGSITNG